MFGDRRPSGDATRSLALFLAGVVVVVVAAVVVDDAVSACVVSCDPPPLLPLCFHAATACVPATTASVVMAAAGIAPEILATAYMTHARLSHVKYASDAGRSLASPPAFVSVDPNDETTKSYTDVNGIAQRCNSPLVFRSDFFRRLKSASFGTRSATAKNVAHVIGLRNGEATESTCHSSDRNKTVSTFPTNTDVIKFPTLEANDDEEEDALSALAWSLVD